MIYQIFGVTNNLNLCILTSYRLNSDFIQVYQPNVKSTASQIIYNTVTWPEIVKDAKRNFHKKKGGNRRSREWLVSSLKGLRLLK